MLKKVTKFGQEETAAQPSDQPAAQPASSMAEVEARARGLTPTKGFGGEEAATVPLMDTSSQDFAASHPWLSKIGKGIAKYGPDVITMGPAMALTKAAAENPKKTAEVLSPMIKSSAKLAAQPLVSVRAGMTGDFKPVNIPNVGEVKPYETPEGSAATYIAEPTMAARGEKITPEQKTAIQEEAKAGVKEALKTSAGAYLEVGAPGAGRLVKKVMGPALPGLEKAGALLAARAAKGFNWISKKSYAQGLKTLLGPEMAQHVSEKVAERTPVGTAGQLINKGKEIMREFDQVIKKEMVGPTGSKVVNVKDIVYPVEGAVEGETAATLSSTGLNRQSRQAEVLRRFMTKADKEGNMTVRKLEAIKQKWGQDIKRLFKKNPAEITPEEEIDLDIYYQMRDKIAEASPVLAAKNADYHYAKILTNSLSRKEAVELRQDWTGLVGNIYSAGHSAEGKTATGIILLVADKIVSNTYGRTAVGAGAKGIERFLLKEWKVSPEAARWLAPIVYNKISEEGVSNLNLSEMSGKPEF